MAFIADNTALEIVDCGAWFYAVKKSGRTDLERGNRFPRGHGRQRSGLRISLTEVL